MSKIDHTGFSNVHLKRDIFKSKCDLEENNLDFSEVSEERKTERYNSCLQI